MKILQVSAERSQQKRREQNHQVSSERCKNVGTLHLTFVHFTGILESIMMVSGQRSFSYSFAMTMALGLFLRACSVELTQAFVAPTTSFRSSPLMLTRRFLSSKDEDESKAPKHDTGGGAVDELPEKVQQQLMAYQEHQQNAPKLDHATDVRTLIQYNHGFAVISTQSKAHPGYPSGSVVGFAPDAETGRPVFIFSGMSGHTQDLLLDPKCSLTIAAKDFKGAADGRVSLLGKCELIKDAKEKENAKALYQAKHPGAFWINFGDFNWFRMDVEHVRFVGGFARAGAVSAHDYQKARPDPVSEFGPAIAKHMNEDHMSSTIAMVEAMVPGMKPTLDDDDDDEASVPKITEAIITSVDSLGMYVKVTREAPVAFLPQQFKLRLPFPRPATDRKDVKTLIVEMTQMAAQATTA